MPMRVPPPEIPVVTFLSPNKGDQGLIEFWNTEVASYTPLDIGAAHPNTRLYPNFRLGKQSPIQGDEKWIIRTWITDETSPDWFNYAQKYSAEDNAYPIFIRTYRELKSTYTPRAKQSTLGALYKLVLDDPGSGYANGALPAIRFDNQVPAPAVVAIGHGVVSPDGSLTECVLDFGGEGYTENVKFTVEDPIDGTPGSGTAYVQPTTAILVKEEANLYPPDSEFYAQYLQVVRVYETLPGPTLTSTKLDVDGAAIVTSRTRGLCADINTGEVIDSGFWIKTTKEATDIDFICEQVQEVRAIPGNAMVTTRVEEDGKITTITKTLGEASGIVSQEVISAGFWVKTHKEDVDGTELVAWQIIESRPVPGNAIPYTRLDDDGKVVTGTRTLKDQSTITTVESLSGGIWTHTFKERVTDLVSWQVTESRPIPGNTLTESKIDEDGKVLSIAKVLSEASAITPTETVNGTWTRVEAVPVSDLVANKVTTTRPLPGNPIPSTQLDDDGVKIDVVRTLKKASTITTAETVTAGIWTKTVKEKVTDLVAWEVVTARPVPGNIVPSASVDQDHEVASIEETMAENSAITPSATESGGVLTIVEAIKVSDLVSIKRVTTKQWLDAAAYSVSIPEGIIPLEFRASITTTVESHILAGTASMPTLAAGEFEHSKKQLTRLLYEERITRLSDIEFPVVQTGTETSTEYGGAILDIVRTLDDSLLTSDEGEDIVSSFVNPIGNSLMWFKETKKRPSGDAAWPILDGQETDPRTGIIIEVRRQVVGAGNSITPVGTEFVDDKPLDKWRTLSIASKLDPGTLPDPVSWETTVEHSFPNTLVAATWLWAAASAGCCYEFDTSLEIEMDQGYAGPCRALITESFTDGAPVDAVTITQFFPKGHMLGYAWALASVSEECGDFCRARSRTFDIPPSLHDAITIAGGVTLDNGVFTSTLPATDPIGLPAPGTLITKSVDVERWRFGVFFRRKTEIYVPG